MSGDQFKHFAYFLMEKRTRATRLGIKFGRNNIRFEYHLYGILCAELHRCGIAPEFLIPKLYINDLLEEILSYEWIATQEDVTIASILVD